MLNLYNTIFTVSEIPLYEYIQLNLFILISYSLMTLINYKLRLQLCYLNVNGVEYNKTLKDINIK